MAVHQFPAGKAADPNGLDAETVKLLPDPAFQWLCTAFDLTLRTSLPRRWKSAVVVPVPKPGKDSGDRH